MSQTFCKENTICFFKALFKFGSTMEENELRVKVNSEGWITPVLLQSPILS